MFRSTIVFRELTLSLAEVTFINSVEGRRYGTRGGVAACINVTSAGLSVSFLKTIVDRNM
jgi:hypothetical protein